MSKESDTAFGFKTKDGKLAIGDKNIMIDGSDIEVLDSDGKVKEKHKGTRGLWRLIVDKAPRNYDDTDHDNYVDLLRKTNAMHRGADPSNTNPAATRGPKFENIIQPIWDKETARPKELRQCELQERKKERKKTKTKGKGVAVVIPEDPNALLERLDLLLSSQEAGHTGVGNELVSICNKLKRQGVISADTYKKLNSYIKI